jgi:polyhydroxybutyrate depolymerase
VSELFLWDVEPPVVHETVADVRAEVASRARRPLPPLLDLALYFFILMGALDMYVEYQVKPDPPKLSAEVQAGAIRVGAVERQYTAFVPARLRVGSPLLLVFHGSAEDGRKMRIFTGYEFDRLADRNGFVVVYPDGFEGNWNDCRKNITFPARTNNLDDKGLVHALIERFHRSHGIDRRRVFAMGFSNGGHFAYRLALEMPDEIAGIAAVAASLPTDDNNICEIRPKPLPVMIINGTGDPINPFVGGEVTLYGLGSRGTVISAQDSARFFVKRIGIAGEPESVELPRLEARDPTSVERLSWGGASPRVVLFRIHEGGHVIPQPYYRAPRMMGRTSHSINGPEEIWKFFAGLGT